jgi:hypothetical protein
MPFIKGQRSWCKGIKGKDSHMFGRIVSKETREKLRQLKLGKPTWNKGIKFTDETKKKMSDSAKARQKIKPFGFKKGHKVWNTGLSGYKRKPHSEATKEKLRQYFGVKSSAWKGGISPEREKIRNCWEYREWERLCKERDKCCRKCGETRMSLVTVHHIKNFAQYPELRFVTDNGICFCTKPCHKLFHHIYKSKDNNQEQVNEFINENPIHNK